MERLLALNEVQNKGCDSSNTSFTKKAVKRLLWIGRITAR
jgi:hypothetical protein